MKKSLLLGAAILCGFSTTVSASKLLTRDEAATEIVNGAVIALQCKDTNGGVNYFFNGNQKKSSHLSYEQLWKVVDSSTAGKFNLQRLSDNKYIGISGSSITLVDDQSGAAPFTAYGATMTPWTTKPESITPATAPSIRFDTNGTFINSKDKNGTPAYASGTGGYSAWYVYKFTEAEVALFEAMAAESYEPTPLAELADHTIVRQMNPVTEVSNDDDGWYMIYSVGQQKFLKQTGKGLEFVEFQNGVDASENAGFIFKIDPAKYTDFGDAYSNITSGFGSFVALDGTDAPQYSNTVASVVTTFPRSISIENVAGDDNQPTESFVLCDKIVNHYASTYQGATFIGRRAYTGNPINFDSNDYFQFFPIDLVEAGEQVVSFTVQLTYKGNVIRTRTVTGIAGEEFHGQPADFFDDEIVVTVPEQDGETITLELTKPTFPFKFTATTDNMIWQAVRQHAGNSRDKNYVWYYSEGATAAGTKRLPANTSEIGFADEELWAFVGDYANGFKIYNKKAGTDVYMIQGTNAVEIGTVDDANANKGLWKPYVVTDRTNYAPTRYCAFRSMAGSNYINMQGINDDAGTANLVYYGAADQGSTCWFRAPSELMLEYATDLVFEQKEIVGHEGTDHIIRQVPEEAVGARNFPDDAEFMTTGPGIIADAEADPYDIEKAAALKQLIADYNEQVVLNQFDVNKWYRILSPCYGTYVRTSHENMNIMAGPAVDSHRKDYHTVFKFDLSDKTDAHDNALYTIYSQGLYFGKANRADNANSIAQVENAADAGLFGPFDADDEPAIYAIGEYSEDLANDTESRIYLHQAAATGNCSVWGKWAPGSHFILMPADDIDFDLNYTLNSKKAGFGYFPFAVTAVTEGTTLYFVHEANGQLSTSQTTTVPAHTAFLAINESKDEVTLSIVSETATPAARVQAREAAQKVMAGTLRPSTAEANDYVVGETADGGLGFVKATGTTNLNGNFVYIPAGNLSSQAQDSDELPLADPTTTGITEINTDNGNAKVYYDLSGRRVSSPKAGIYVTGNGKKIVL